MRFLFLFFVWITQFYVSAQPGDSIVIRQIDSFIDVSRTLREKRDFENARNVLESAEKLSSSKFGFISERRGRCLFQLGLTYYDEQNYKDSEKYFKLAKSIFFDLYGRNHPLFADCLKNLSNLHYDKGEYKEAENLNLEEKEIREVTAGRESLEYISCINNLSTLYQTTGAYTKAEPLSMEALFLSEKLLGNKHPEHLNCMNNLAILYYEMANYEKAEELFIRLWDYRKEIFGGGHLEVSASLNNLGLLYETIGSYSKAEPLYLQSKNIIEQKLGKGHSDYVMILQNLANLYWHWGNYQLAEANNLEAKDVLEKTIGKNHPNYALTLDNLGSLYHSLGGYQKAEKCFLEAQSIRENILGKSHQDYARSLYSLATLYFDINEFSKAEKMYSEALEIMEQNFGKEHPNYGLGLSNLANLYSETGQYSKADSLYSTFIKIQGNALGVEHPDYASGLNNLADLYHKMGRYEDAEKLYVKVRDIREMALGKQHPDFAKVLKNLADTYERKGDYDKSESLLAQYFSIMNGNLRQSISFLSEQELAQYVMKESDADILGTYIHLRKKKERAIGSLPSLLYDQTLFQKGFLLHAVSSMNQRLNKDSATMEASTQLKSYRRMLAREYSLPIAERDESAIAEFEEKANIAEKKLARSVTGYDSENFQLKWQKVAEFLSALEKTKGEKAAAVEFIHFNFSEKENYNYYAALVLLPHSIQPVYIPMFEERKLDSLVMHGKKIEHLANELYAARGAVPQLTRKTYSENLYEILWKPIESELKGVSKIYFALSGKLSQLNFGAIPLDGKKVLDDIYTLNQLSSTRQLSSPRLVGIENQFAVLFGGITYDADLDAMTASNKSLHSSESFASRGAASFSVTDSNMRVVHWDYLPGTEQEVNDLEKLLTKGMMTTETYRGFMATEEAFKSVGSGKAQSPRILHIATHGYFFPNPSKKKDRDGRADQELVFKISDNPLIRSGLILAGGNYSWQKGRPMKTGMEDGILTAYEISQMNLSNTELVVLSACETGLGDIQGNEGVYGLQRAFKIAGVKYIIMSLWQVPDKQTSLLMTTFYKKWLANKMTIPDAFHAAQKELREIGLDPYQWAGFVLIE